MSLIFNTFFTYLTERISVHHVTFLFVKNMLQFLGHRLFYTCVALDLKLCTVTEAKV
jgi:hypothetical protein